MQKTKYDMYLDAVNSAEQCLIAFNSDPLLREFYSNVHTQLVHKMCVMSVEEAGEFVEV